MKGKIMFYIVTPVYNRRKFTENYLDALLRQSVKDFKVIIVDDGSTDGTSEMIEQGFPEVILLKEEGDLWWAEATNVGVRYALEHNADYIMTLNDDTLPVEDFVEKMLYWAEKQPKALLGAFAIDVDTNKPVYGGEIRYWSLLKKNINLLTTTIAPKDQHGLHEVNIYPGRGLLIPYVVFQEIGLYDSKNFPQTYADYDFTFRAIKKGYKIFSNYDAVIKVYQDESLGQKLKREKSFSNYFKHLFNIRGGGNLKFFTICVFKNTPKLYTIPYLVRGWLGRIVGYWVK